MRFNIILAAALFLLAGCFSSKNIDSDYTAEIEKYRVEYKKKFLENEHAPLQKADLPFLNFFAPDPTYRVTADFTRTPDAKPFEMPTVSGKVQNYVTYGTADFTLNGEKITLSIYKNLGLARMPQYRNYLFLPFNDATNSAGTYGGGRYLDLKTGDIKNGKIVLDFNKVYNPYCAYSDGYNCPIPPRENKLAVKIEAGEKNFTGKYKGEH